MVSVLEFSDLEILALLLVFFVLRQQPSSVGQTWYYLRRSYQLNRSCVKATEPSPEDDPWVGLIKKIFRVIVTRIIVTRLEENPVTSAVLIQKLSGLLQQYLLCASVIWPSLLIIAWLTGLPSVPLDHVFFTTGFFWSFLVLLKDLFGIDDE